jgi:hypothetical protein
MFQFLRSTMACSYKLYIRFGGTQYTSVWNPFLDYKNVLWILFMFVAPFPLSVRYSHHYWMPCFIKVLCCMKTDRRIATAYMTTDQAHSKSDPISSFLFTFFAAWRFWSYIFIYSDKVFTGFLFIVHFSNKPLISYKYVKLSAELNN